MIRSRRSALVLCWLILLLPGCYSAPEGEDVSVLVINTPSGFPTGPLKIDGKRVCVIGGPLKPKPVPVEPGERKIKVALFSAKAVTVKPRTAYKANFKKLQNNVTVSLEELEPGSAEWSYGFERAGLKPPKVEAKEGSPEND